MTGLRSPTEAEDFSSSVCIQTGSGAHPASCPMGTGVHSPGVKHGQGVMLTTHPRLVPRLRMSRSYNSSAPRCLMHVGRHLCLFFLTTLLEGNLTQSSLFCIFLNAHLLHPPQAHIFPKVLYLQTLVIVIPSK
jgi:hypothetical protein